MYDKQEVLETLDNRAFYLSELPSLKFNGQGPDEGKALCPFHADQEPSLSVNVASGKWYCHACGEGGDVFTFLQKRFSLSFPEAVTAAAERAGMDPRKASTKSNKAPAKVVETYDYSDENGELLFQVCRMEPKSFFQRRPDGKGGWINGMGGVRRVLYKLPDVLSANVIFLVEGEKDVHALATIGIRATTNPHGAGKWRPEYTEALRDKKVVILPDNDEPGKAHAEAVAKALQGKARAVKIVNLPDLKPKGDVSDWINAGGTKDQLLKLVQSIPEYGEAREDEDRPTSGALNTDIGNAERFISRHGADVLYCFKWKDWLLWDGKRWQPDENGKITGLAKETAKSIFAEASQANDKDEAKTIVKHAFKSQYKTRLEAMTALAQCQVPVSPDELDADPWLLNVQNGTLNLKTCEIQPHNRQDKITKLAPVEYDPYAKCPQWQAFLQKVLAGDETLIQFVQRAVGYSLTGSTREQCFFVLYGTGANGKSVFLTTLQSLLADYATQADFSAFLVKHNDNSSNDIARLKGARFVSASETGAGKRLNESLVKQLTGGDVITARHLYSEFFEFKAQFKLWLASNFKPTITGQDLGIWRRVRMIPFTVTIPPEEQDHDLTEKLKGELPGILTWAVCGLEDWQNKGLGESEAVSEATKGYRDEMDILGPFLDECCFFEPSARVKTSTLKQAYAEWCLANGEKPFGRVMFANCLQSRGCNPIKGTGGVRMWEGIGLMDTAPF